MEGAVGELGPRRRSSPAMPPNDRSDSLTSAQNMYGVARLDPSFRQPFDALSDIGGSSRFRSVPTGCMHPAEHVVWSIMGM